ncbi:hypothetical protein F5Y11DRAFT_324423 [Daldinia sp. FL1419]|nr:hypothetical protein F5Y11DRAFT_324423 [Daldinia sp. FL1419]
MLFKHVISAATFSAFYEVASASRCKPRTSSSEPVPTTPSYSTVPLSTYAISNSTSSYFVSTTSSVAVPSTTSDDPITSSTVSSIESSSAITSASSSSSFVETSSSESIIATETASSTSSLETSSSEGVSATETTSSAIPSTISSISSIETSSSITSSSIIPSVTSSSEIPSSTSSTTSSAEPTPTNTDVIANSGFETVDPIVWTYTGYHLDLAASGSLDTDPYSGSRSFIAQGLPGLWQIRLQQTVSVVAGQAYTFQYTLKMDPTVGCVMDILINNVRTRRPDLNQYRGVYTTYTDLWTADRDTATILFSSQCNSGGPMNKLYYDDVTLTTVPAPEVTMP